MSNLASILDRPSNEVERPKPLPVGTYTCVVSGPHREDKSTKKGTPFVEYILKPLAAGEDVDEDDLNTWMLKGDGTSRNLMDSQIRATYYLTEDAIWRLKDFLDHCGAGDDSMSLRQRLDAAPGCQVIVHMRHEPSDDGTSVFARLGKTAPVE